MLQGLDRIPCLEHHRRSKDWGQIIRAPHSVSPLLQLFVLIPVRIVDDRIASPCCGQNLLASRERGVKRSQLVSQIEVIMFVRLELTDIIVVDRRPGSPPLPRRRAPPQRIEPNARKGPPWLGFQNSPPSTQDGMGASDLVGWRPDVHPLIVENEVFNVDELAGEPQTVAGVGEMGSGDPTIPDRAARQSLVEPGDSVFGRRKRRGDQRPWNLGWSPNSHARSI